VSPSGGKDERVVADEGVLDVSQLGLQRDHRGIERARSNLCHQRRRLLLHPNELESRKRLPQGRRDLGQQIRRDGRDHPDAQPTPRLNRLDPSMPSS
jgi:hypothetical protein